MSYYDRKGNPISFEQFIILWQMKERRVALTEGPGWRVSTVWLGLNHSFGGGPPLIFETMSFEEGEEQEQERYATEAEALAGHEAVVAKVRARHPAEAAS